MQKGSKMWREDRQARTLRPKQQHSGEFPRLVVCLIYSRLGIEKLPTRECKQVQTNKQKSTPLNPFLSFAKDQERDSLKRNKTLRQ